MSSVNIKRTKFWKETHSGQILAGFRLKHGLTQKELAEEFIDDSDNY